MEDTDFPEYGRQCELKEPWRGYHRGIGYIKNIERYIGSNKLMFSQPTSAVLKNIEPLIR